MNGRQGSIPKQVMEDHTNTSHRWTWLQDDPAEPPYIGCKICGFRARLLSSRNIYIQAAIEAVHDLNPGWDESFDRLP